VAPVQLTPFLHAPPFEVVMQVLLAEQNRLPELSWHAYSPALPQQYPLVAEQ
jgi:hypothetical protein